MKKLILPALAAVCLALGSVESRAAIIQPPPISIADWKLAGSGGVTVGDVTWVCLATTSLPNLFMVSFSQNGTFEITSGKTPIIPTVDTTFYLDYTAVLNNGYNFTGVRVDSDAPTGGPSSVSKTVYDNIGGAPLVTVTSVNGGPDPAVGYASFAYPSTSIKVNETIWVKANADLESFSNGYTTAVPEPATVLAGSLLLLPFAASAVRRIRKNKA